MPFVVLLNSWGDGGLLSWSCVCQGPKKVGALWREAGLSWKEFLPEGQDVGAFITEQVCAGVRITPFGAGMVHLPTS